MLSENIQLHSWGNVHSHQQSVISTQMCWISWKGEVQNLLAHQLPNFVQSFNSNVFMQFVQQSFCDATSKQFFIKLPSIKASNYLFWRQTFLKNIFWISVSELHELLSVFWILQNTFWLKSERSVSKCHLKCTLWNANTAFTYHTYDAAFILNKMPLLHPLLLKYWSLLLTSALHFTFVTHGFYLGSESLHMKHTPLIITTTQFSTALQYRCFPWTFLITKLTHNSLSHTNKFSLSL